MTDRTTTVRVSRVGRIYPKIIHEWTDFQEKVENYKIIEYATSLMNVGLEQIFYSSLDRATRIECRSEIEEQIHLIFNLSTLSMAGIIQSVETFVSGVVGQMEFCIRNEDIDVSIICECKSTENLLLPMKAHQCKIAYDSAQNQTNKQT